MYHPVQKVSDFIFFPEKPVTAGWQIWSQWWGGPSWACVICCGLTRWIFLS
jgi:hypothetical protein